MKKKAKTPPVTEQQLMDPIEHAVLGYLARLPNPPWEAADFFWPRPQGADRDAFLDSMAASLDQAAQWVADDAHGPCWLSMLRNLAVHLDLECSLPEHGEVIRQMRERLSGVSVSASERVTEATRLRSLAAGMRYYLQNPEMNAAPSWQAPHSWDERYRQTAQDIHSDLERAANYSQAWSLFDPRRQSHPCHEGDTAGELWSRRWCATYNGWFAAGFRIFINGQVREREFRNFIRLHRPHLNNACETVFLAIEAHNREVSILKPRALKDQDIDKIPPFTQWGQRLRELASDWRTLVCFEERPVIFFTRPVAAQSLQPVAISVWRQEVIHLIRDLIAPVLEKWRVSQVEYAATMGRSGWEPIDTWWNELQSGLKNDAGIWEWANLHLIEPLGKVDPRAEDALDQVVAIVERMGRLANVLAEGKDSEALVWDVPKPVAKNDGAKAGTRDSMSSVPLTQSDQSIADNIANKPGIMAKELGRICHMTETAVRKRLASSTPLHQRGYRQKQGRRGYFPPEHSV